MKGILCVVRPAASNDQRHTHCPSVIFQSHCTHVGVLNNIQLRVYCFRAHEMLSTGRVQVARGTRHPYESEESNCLCHSALTGNELLAHLQPTDHPSRRESVRLNNPCLLFRRLFALFLMHQSTLQITTVKTRQPAD